MKAEQKKNLAYAIEIKESFENALTLITQLHQKIRFLEIFFRILNMFDIVSYLQKKI